VWDEFKCKQRAKIVYDLIGTPEHHFLTALQAAIQGGRTHYPALTNWAIGYRAFGAAAASWSPRPFSMLPPTFHPIIALPRYTNT
jgi:hypothetical protein